MLTTGGDWREIPPARAFNLRQRSADNKRTTNLEKELFYSMKQDRNQTRKKTSDYFLVYHSVTHHVIGRIADLSQTGLLLVTADPVPLNTPYALKMLHPRRNLKREFIIFTAEARWNKFKDHADWWENGLEITEIDPEDISLLHQLVEWLVSDEARRLSEDEANKDKSIPKIEYIKIR